MTGSSSTRTLVVGDVHGCLGELKELLRRSGFRRGSDRLVFAGDLVDRGPDSLGVVRLAMEMGAESVMGNHEEKHLRYRRHSIRAMVDRAYKNPMFEPHPHVHKSFGPAEWEWLGRLPLTVWLNDSTVVVHGGFALDSTPQHPHLNSCRIRFVDVRTEKSVPGIGSVGQPDGALFWTGLYDGGENGRTNVIFGHQPFQRPNVTRNKGYWTLGLDTGCCYGDYLSGYWLEDREFVFSHARRSYFGRDCPSR